MSPQDDPGAPESIDDGWEARMAARAAQRHARSQEGLAEALAFFIRCPSGWPPLWLNGWRRVDLFRVWMGSQSACIGCGTREPGCASIVIEEGRIPPPEPVWPFSPEGCAVCWGGRNPHVLLWEPRFESRKINE